MLPSTVYVKEDSKYIEASRRASGICTHTLDHSSAQAIVREMREARPAQSARQLILSCAVLLCCAV
jgi:hypothetical protein